MSLSTTILLSCRRQWERKGKLILISSSN